MKHWILPKTPWHECVAEGLRWGLPAGAQLHVVSPSAVPLALGRRPRADGCVLVAPHRLSDEILAALPRRTLCYEVENLFGPWCAQRERVNVRRPDLRWLNYSAANCSVFGDEFEPLRYPTPFREAPRGGEGVLFVGSMNARRAQILDDLRGRGVRVQVATTAAPLFGDALAAATARADLVLNVHYYEVPAALSRCGLFESFRCVPALWRGRRVLSERGVDDPIGIDGLELCAYEDLVDRALEILSSPSAQ